MSTPADNLPPVPITPDLFIPQVPFKQLPFPWNDLTNTPQPDATQYFPDHAPSVVATLAGMHPTDQQGQTVNTDGNHAILVKSVDAASGSGPAVPKYNNGGTNWAGFGDLSYPFIHDVKTIFSIDGYIHSWRSNGRTAQALGIAINGPGVEDHYPLIQTYGIYTDMDYPPDDIMFPIKQIFPNGLDISGMFSTLSGLTLDVTNGASFWGSFWINIAYSD